MLKSKFKFMFLIVAIVTLISTLSFATDASEEASLEDLLAAANVEVTDNAVTTGEDSNNHSQEEPEWVNNDLYLMGDKVEINQIVDGNVFVMANEVVISSEIGGDVFVLANKITIDGAYIYSSLFAAGNEVTINGIICDAYVVSNDFTLDTNGYIYRDLKASANTLNLKGKIRRDAYLSGVNFSFDMTNGAIIGGNLKYTSGADVTVPAEAVLGNVLHDQSEVKTQSVGEKILSYIFDAISLLVYTFVVILLAIWLAPKFIERVSNMNTKKAFVSLGIGAATIIVVPIAIILLLVSGICSSVGIAATLVFTAICMSATAFASIYFGSLFAKLVKWDGKVKFVLASLIVALIMWVISHIPFIGWLFGFLFALFGIGTFFVNVVYKKEAKSEEMPIQE